LTLCAIWAPLREIVSERINVDSLEADGINLIADMAERRRTLSFKLDADRAEMRAQAHSLYTTIITEIRKQETRIKQLSAFGDSLNFGNVSGMQIVTHRKRDLLDLLHSVAKQIDLFASQSNVPLDAHLNDIFAKTLGTRFDGQALLDYRTYLDVTIEVRRNNQWESATGLSGGESIGGGLALSLMLARSLAIRGSLGRGRHFTPIFVVDEVQRLNAAGQALIVEFGRRQGFQVIVTGLSLDASFPCTMHVMSRHFRPQETVVARRVKVAAQDAA
jgi:chromosome condensin MukBEF ATPase and DNA-binding subunit MukB